ncbi:HAD family hydrolase [Caproiciproducens sp. LBM24188]|nr:HAD family hydrolase [Clostridiales bacterium]
MIRLIASDMDGSLLNDEKKIPPEFFEVLPRLHEKGIRFFVASGRSYCTLKDNFAAVADQIGYICDNGANVYYQDVCRVKLLPGELLKPLLLACEELPGIQILLCGVNGTYVKSYSKEFDFEIGNYYHNRRFVERLTDVNDDIFKVAICDMKNPMNRTYPFLKERFGDKLNLQVSGMYWMDVMNREVNKGTALETIQNELGISPEETMAFGDFYNDIQLLQHAKYSFVMANSNEDMRQYGNYMAESNNDNGVMKAIRKYALQEE